MSSDPRPLSESTRGTKFVAVAAVIVAAAMWALSVFIPVWETRSDGGKWAAVIGALPLLIGWLGLVSFCPAWFANLLVIPLYLTLFKGRHVGFWLSVVAFAIAATAYMIPALYGDNEEDVIVARRIGFYLWVGSFLVIVLAHALQFKRVQGPLLVARWTTFALLVLAAVGLEHKYRVGVSPLEAAIRNPDPAAFAAILARHPSQSEKDAALPWVMLEDLTNSPTGVKSERVEELVAAGANVNQADSYGTTPLMRAVRTRGAESVVALLVRAGANVNARNGSGYSVLDIADEYGCSPECRQILVDAGALASNKPKQSGANKPNQAASQPQ